MIVADAGPLIHLDALQSKFLSKQVPTQAGAELEALAKLYTLHLGEIQAIALCNYSPNSRLLTDDTAARMAAKALGIPANGTLGVILRALRLGSLSKSQTIDLLESIPASSSLHIKNSLLAEIINEVRNY